MKLKIEVLEKVSRQLFDYLNQLEVKSIEIKDDYYWNVPKKFRYDPYQKPVELDLGQLSDDLDKINAIANGENEPIAYSLVWLSELLKYVGENVSS